jgi:hypothetical protein
MPSTLDEALRLGSEAEYIMNSDAFQQSFKEIETDWLGQWASGNIKTTQEREDLFFRIQGLHAFRSKLISLLDNKRVAKDQIERANKRAGQAA